MNAPYVLAGLLAATGGYYVTTRILLRRRLASEAYRAETATRIDQAAWRAHRGVTYLDGGYAYKPEYRKEVGSDEARMGVVRARESLAGGKGSGLPCRYCGEVGGHTGQCPVVSHHFNQSRGNA